MTVPHASGLTVLQVIIGIFAFLPRPLWWEFGIGFSKETSLAFKRGLPRSRG